MRVLLLSALCGIFLGACAGGAPTSPTTTTITVTGSGATTYTYATVQAIFASDCVSCHGPSQKQAGVDLSTYTGVSRVVTAGSDQSTLVRVTQPGGLMYSNLSGNRSDKAGMIYDWVVNSRAAQ
ncbi:MAG: c-type cytochrome domain-containing protein [Acidobacteriota bacterium]